MNTKKLFADLDKEARYRSEQLQEMLQDVAHKMVRDQDEWLDMVMKDILPPHLYEAGKHEDNMQEVEAWLKAHKFQLIFIPDSSMAIRVMRGDRVHAQFVPQFTVDGEPIEAKPTGFMPDKPETN